MDTVYWSPTNSTWSDSEANWNTSADGQGTSIAWTDRTQQAVFPGTSSGTITVSGTIGLTGLDIEGAGYTFTGGTLNLTGDAVLTINQDTSIASTLTGSVGLTKQGTGKLTLSGTNTFTGGTTLEDGTLTLGSSSALGSTTNALTVGPLGTLNLHGYNLQAQSLRGTGGTILNNAAATTATLTVQFSTSADSGTFSGLLENNSGSGGALALEVLGSTTLTLNLATGQAYTGTTHVGSGSVLAITKMPLGNISIDGAAVLKEYGTATWPAGTLTASGGGYLAIYGSLTFSGGSWSFSSSAGPVAYGTLNLSGGSLSAATITTYGTTNWNSGNITMATYGFSFVNYGGTINFQASTGNIFTLNHFSLTNYGTINFKSGEVDFLNGSSLDNEGTVHWTGGTIKLAGGSYFGNGGTFTISNDVTLNVTGSYLYGEFDNEGTIEWYGDTSQQGAVSGGTINTH